jgi:hypothetical protein
VTAKLTINSLRGIGFDRTGGEPTLFACGRCGVRWGAGARSPLRKAISDAAVGYLIALSRASHRDGHGPWAM